MPGNVSEGEGLARALGTELVLSAALAMEDQDPNGSTVEAGPA